MATEMIPPTGFLIPPESPAEWPPSTHLPGPHADWCAERARHCVREARAACFCGLSPQRWLQAARMFRFARDQWRARQERAA
jgi:hypothetical protein